MSKTESGREPVQIVEIDQAICVNTWGVAPCAAALAASVPNKCFNTRKTCADPDNFTLAVLPLTLRFCKTGEVVPRSWGAIPCLESVSTTPCRLNPGNGSKNSGPLGARATVTIKMRDLPYADFKVDPYQAERFSGAAQFSGVGYNPKERGTFWGKWLRRNPYFVNFPIRILEGYIEDDPASMVTRNYIIEDISEPGGDGKVTIKAQDIFGLADDKTAQCPAPSLGTLDRDMSAVGYQIDCRYAAGQWTAAGHGTNEYYFNPVGVLTTEPDEVYCDGVLQIPGTVASLNQGEWDWADHDAIGHNTLYVRLVGGDDPDSKAAGWVQAEYQTLIHLENWTAGEYPAGGGTIRMGDEVATYTVAAEVALICTLSGVVRGTDGTTATDHSDGDAVQLCYRVADADDIYCWEVVEELLTTYAAIPAAYIPSADWATEGTIWLPIFTVTTLITEPTSVNQLIGELCEQCLFDIWWDERDQEIKLRALRSPSEAATEFNDRQHILKDSWSLKSDMGQRVSEVWVWYAPKDPTKKLDETTNYSQLHILDNPALEAVEMYGVPAVKTIYSRWLESGTQCVQLINRYLQRFQDGTKYLKIRVDAKDGAVWTGEVVAVTLHSMVDEVGLPEQRRWQVISAEDVIPGEVIEYNLQNYLIAAARYLVWQAGVGTRTGKWADADGLVAGIKGYSWK